MSIFNTKLPTPQGIGSIYLGRNGGPTDGWSMARIASLVNMLASRRMHVLASMGVRSESPGVPQPARAYFHTSPNSKGVEALIIASKSNANATHGYYEWTVNGTTMSRRYFGGRSGGASAPNEMIVDRQRLLDGANDLAADAVHYATFNVNTDMRVHYVILFEVPRSQLDTAVDVAVPLDVFQAGAPILDRDVTDLTEALWKIYRRQGAHHFNWCRLATGGAATQLGTTFANVLDGVTTGYGANAAGFWLQPYRRGRLVSSGTVEAVFWCRSSITGGAGTGRVRLVNSAGTLVTITGITGAGEATYTGTCLLDATLASGDLAIVEQSGSDAGTTVSTAACGVYDYKT